MTGKLLLVRAAAALTAMSVLCPTQSVFADFTRLGNTLIGTGAIGAALQGSVALSGNGNTAIVGGNFDNSKLGAAWVFTRSPGGNWVQQGSKLVGGNSVGAAQQGFSVALSADGNTAIVGGPDDNSNVGAAWIFTRNGGMWSQQGPKLVGSNSVGAHQGFSVALSGDGNTAIIGGPNDNNNDGAAWVFTRSGGVWSEQVKLIGTGAAGHAQQGSSVALSGDGNTAIIGGSFDNANAGAVWVFVRGGGGWTQQGAKLAGTGAVGAAVFQGVGVALSGDGNTAVVGGTGDSNSVGAAWVFARSGGVWTQQGAKLVGAGAAGQPNQGNSVALSLDGNTAIVGGPADNSGAGAAWAFTRSGGTWSPLGAKLVAFGHSDVAFYVALSGDGNTALLGAPGDNSNAGGAFPFVQPGAKLNPAATHDFDNNNVSDILLENTGGGIAMWLMRNNATIQSAVGVGSTTPGVWTIIGQRDLNNDGKVDILFRATDGSIAEWLMNGATITSATGLGNPTTSWTIVGTGDFNNDGVGDVLFRGGGTAVAIWYMNNSGGLASAVGVGSLPNDWTVAGTGDFDGDAVWDILWFNTSSSGIATWLMNPNGTVKAAVAVGSLPAGWSIAGTGDFNNDGIGDILLSNSGNGVAIWFMNSNGTIGSAQGVGTMAPGWTIAQTGDFNEDGTSDVLLYHSASGAIAAWLMSGATISSFVGIGSLPPSSWIIVTANSE